jgi:hypothetical protein
VLTTCQICQAALYQFDRFAEKLPELQSPAIVHIGLEQELDTTLCNLHLNTCIR